MMKVECFEDLEIWQEARELCKLVKEVTSKGTFKSDYRFKEQIRASSGSTMDNIAEGFERGGNKEFIQFLYISKGSCGEVRSQAYRAFDYNHINQDELNELLDLTKKLSKKISNFIKYLKNSNFKGSKYN
jgi:four helix bundle protein